MDGSHRIRSRRTLRTWRLAGSSPRDRVSDRRRSAGSAESGRAFEPADVVHPPSLVRTGRASARQAVVHAISVWFRAFVISWQIKIGTDSAETRHWPQSPDTASPY